MALDSIVRKDDELGGGPSPGRRRRPELTGHRSARELATLVCWVLAAATLVPLVEVVYQSFRKQTGLLTSVFSLDSYRQLFTAQIFHSAGLSLEFGLGSAVIAVVVGGALAWLLVRTDIPWRGFFEIAALIPFFLSPFILAITWQYTGSPNTGLFNRALIGAGLTHSAVLNIYSTFGIILVIGMAHVPLAYLMISGTLRQIDPSLEQAARVSGAGPLRTGLQVTARLASPGIISAFIIAFVLGFEDLGVPLVLGVPSGIMPLSVRIWQTIQQTFPANYNFAAAASVFMMLIPAIAFWLQRCIAGRRPRYTVGGKSSAPQRVALGRAKWPAFGVCLLWTLFSVVLPLLTLVLTAFQRRWTGSVNLGILTFSNFAAVFHNSSSALPVLPALTNSLLLSACTATLVIVCAVAVTYGVNRLRARGGRVADVILSMPLAVPGTAVAVGLLNLLIRTPLYATVWIIGLAYAIRYFPYALRPVDAALGAVHPELEEAARVSGRGLVQTVRLVIVPLLRPGMISGWLILFVMFMREVAISNLLYEGGNSTLSVALRSLSSLEPDGVVAAFTLMQIVLFLLIAGLALLAGGSRRAVLRLPT
jgi:iron(III) transport system permease protein